VLHEELPQVFAVFTVVFECGVMFAEMLGDCFTDSLLHCFSRDIGDISDIGDASALFSREYNSKGTRPPEQIADAYKRAKVVIRRV
jgi:hypothetical protein